MATSNDTQTESTTPADLRELRDDFPDYSFSSTWRSAASGPDCRILLGWRSTDRAPLAAFSASELRRRIKAEEEAGR